MACRRGATVWLSVRGAVCVLAALQSIAETVVARVDGSPCPIPFDTAAYARDFAASIGVAPSRVRVRVVCRTIGAMSMDATPHHRQLQSDGAELEIIVEVSGLSESEASGVRACLSRESAMMRMVVVVIIIIIVVVVVMAVVVVDVVVVVVW